MKFKEYESPCGRLLLGVEGESLCLCDWIIGDRIEKSLRRISKFISPSSRVDDTSILTRAVSELDEYFSGRRMNFEIPLAAYGTDLQRRVWQSLMKVPYGTTLSYSAIAQSVGLPRGVRAVASAVGANPLSILIPCHRIIKADGSLSGYAGGVDAKIYLLQLERLSHR